MKLADLINKLQKVEEVYGNPDIEFENVQYDSRKVKEGDLFVAIKGFSTDGHLYIEEAVKSGAIAIVADVNNESLSSHKRPEGAVFIVVDDSRRALSRIAEQVYGSPSSKVPVFGVTGTNGKTTTAYLIKQIAELSGYKSGFIGTTGLEYCGKTRKAALTTPESYDLACYMNEMIESGVDFIAMEVSSHALKLDRVADVAFQCAIFTNLTHDHLDFHFNSEDYYESKKKLFIQKDEKTDSDFIAVINIDDEAGRKLVRDLMKENNSKNNRIITYGKSTDADYRMDKIELNKGSVSYEVIMRKSRIHLDIPLGGRFNAYNSLAAFCSCVEWGIEEEVVGNAMKSIKPAPGRFQLITTKNEYSVIVDYAHTPDSLENLIESARDITNGKLITVFGCGGERDKSKRQMMGRVSAKLSDYSIITSDNPRGEDPVKIIEEILGGFTECRVATYEVEADREKAIERAISLAEKGDSVIIAGKGHEACQIIGNKRIPFDDADVVKKFI